MPCKGNVFISNCKYKSFQAFVLISAFDFRATVIITIIKSYTKNGPLSNYVLVFTDVHKQSYIASSVLSGL